MRLEIKKGRDIKPGIIKEIDKLWANAFNVPDYDRLTKDNSYYKDIFFILFDKKDILSTGRLIRIKRLRFMNQYYKLLGIADIVSVVEGRGYGKKIMLAIKRYLNKNKEIGIGFCKKNNSQFYRKSGFMIAEGLSKRFRFSKKRKLVKNSWDEDVLYNYYAKGLIGEMLNNPQETAVSLRPSW